jgi:hypothetical protein
VLGDQPAVLLGVAGGEDERGRGAVATVDGQRGQLRSHLGAVAALRAERDQQGAPAAQRGQRVRLSGEIGKREVGCQRAHRQCGWRRRRRCCRT